MITDAGYQGFSWFIGVVEDRDDPLMLGRVRVRIYNVHSQDTTLIPTEDLPWATILNSPTSASHSQVGVSPNGLMVGSTVVGFFMDGKDSQLPVVMGSIAGIPEGVYANHDVPPRARQEDNLASQIYGNLLGTEPAPAYAAQYPYNKVTQTESGHVIEVDDTPGNERLAMFHKSGTYTEIDSEGRRVQKIVGDDFEIVQKDKNVYVKGSVNVIVEGSASITVSKTCSIKSTLPMLLDSTTSIIMSAPFVSINGSVATSVKGKVLGLNTNFGDLIGTDTTATSELSQSASVSATDQALSGTNSTSLTQDLSNMQASLTGSATSSTSVLSDVAGGGYLPADSLQELELNDINGKLSSLGYSLPASPTATDTFSAIKNNIGTIYNNASKQVIDAIGPVVKEGSKYGVTLESVSRVVANPQQGLQNIIVGNVSKIGNILPDSPEMASIKQAYEEGKNAIEPALRVVIKAGGDPKQLIAAVSSEFQDLAVQGLNNQVSAAMPGAVATQVLPENSSSFDRVANAFKDATSTISQATADVIDKVYGVSDTAKQYIADVVPDAYKRYV